MAITYSSSPEKAQSVVTEIEAAGVKALAIKADAANADEVRAAVTRTVEELGGLDILINNAGVAVIGPFEALSLEDFDRMVNINVRGLFVASQEAARHLKPGGRIIHIGSINADRMPFAGGAVYALTKGAVASFTQGLARDLGPRGITVNNVQPGPVATEMNPDNGEFSDLMRSLTALGRYGQDTEIASFVSYLAGPETGYITGANLTIDGGFGA